MTTAGETAEAMVSADANRRRLNLRLLGLLLLAALLSAGSFVLLDPRVLGLFHDDAVYAGTARALAETGTYTIPTLPGSPPQTKYPPLYSWLLGLMWYWHPNFPANILWLKAVNIMSLFLGLLGMAYWTRRSPALLSVLVLVLFGTNPGLVGFADYTMSDVLFVSFVVWTLALRSEKGRDDKARNLLTLALVSGAVLTRAIGVCLAAAVILDHVWARRWRWAVYHTTGALLTVGAWQLWATGAGSTGTDPLLSYYLHYETSAIGYLRTLPSLAWSIVSGNMMLGGITLPLVLGPGALLGPVLLLPLGIGARLVLRGRDQLALLFALVYSIAVLLHPFSPHRYLLPLVPLVYYLIIVSIGCSSSETTWRSARSLLVGVSVAVILLGNLAWVVYRATPLENGNIRGWYGIDLGSQWSGFEETFEWIRKNTKAADRLGSIYDPMYSLYTGRAAVRPWFHRSETYFYPYGNATPFVGHPEEVAAALRGLGISILILDPPNGYAEGPAAIRMLRGVLDLPMVDSELVFTSGDGRHHVYRLNWPE